MAGYKLTKVKVDRKRDQYEKFISTLILPLFSQLRLRINVNIKKSSTKKSFTEDSPSNYRKQSFCIFISSPHYDSNFCIPPDNKKSRKRESKALDGLRKLKSAYVLNVLCQLYQGMLKFKLSSDIQCILDEKHFVFVNNEINELNNTVKI